MGIEDEVRGVLQTFRDHVFLSEKIFENLPYDKDALDGYERATIFSVAPIQGTNSIYQTNELFYEIKPMLPRPDKQYPSWEHGIWTFYARLEYHNEQEITVVNFFPDVRMAKEWQYFGTIPPNKQRSQEQVMRLRRF